MCVCVLYLLIVVNLLLCFVCVSGGLLHCYFAFSFMLVMLGCDCGLRF